MSTTITSLPAPIKAFFDATKKQSTKDVLSCFATDATITDEGVTMRNHYILKAWIVANWLIPKPTITINSTTQVGSLYVLSVTMDGDYAADYNIHEPFPLDFHIALTPAGDHIAALTITGPGEGTMTAVYATHTSPADPLTALAVGRVPVPAVPDGWVLVRLRAASLNMHDVWTLRGLVHPRVTFPHTLGLDGVGVLATSSSSGEQEKLVGIYGLLSDDDDFRGDETQDPARHFLSDFVSGTLATFVAIPRRNAVPLPLGMTATTAAALGAAWLTAYRMIFTQAASVLSPGRLVLVQGSSGGVASALIQLAAAAGFRVWATGRTPEKRRIASELGAEKVFEPGFEVPEGERPDAVFDTAGAATWSHSIASVRVGGVVVACGFHSKVGKDMHEREGEGEGEGGVQWGNVGEVSMNLMRCIADQIQIKGVYAGTLEDYRNLLAFVHSKGIMPRIAKVLPLENAAEGLRDMYKGTTSGKIVITM